MNNVEAASNIASIVTRNEKTSVTPNSLTNESSINKKIDDSTKKVSSNVISGNSVSDNPPKSNLTDIVNKINKTLTAARDLKFSVDENSGQLIVSVYEKGSGELIRQLPSEDALKLLANLEQFKGVLFNSKA